MTESEALSLPGTKQHKAYVRKSYIDKTLSVVSISYFAVYFILPQYFGIPLPFFDFTAQRIFVVIGFIYIFSKQARKEKFTEIVYMTPGFAWLMAFMFVLTYTAGLRAHPGTFLYSFVEFMAMFEAIYFVREGLGVKKTLQLIIIFSYILTLLGVLEYVMKRPIFSYMETIKGVYGGIIFRSGNYRITGPANVALAYGLMLMIMLPVACLDTEKDEIYLFKRPVLFLLIMLNVLLTGSRSTLAVFGVEVIAIIVFSNRSVKKKTFLSGILMILVVAAAILLTWGTGFSNYMMLQITSVIDELFDTTYSVRFGADLTTLAGSSNYRTYLPKIFTLDWLNPLLGRGSQNSFAWYVDGIYIESIDNFYVAQYIRYAYPGLVTYVMYMLRFVLRPLIEAIKQKSGLFQMLFIGITGYFVNLWYLDHLQTLKYVYLLVAVWVGCMDYKTRKFVPYGEFDKVKEEIEECGKTEVLVNKINYIKRKKK
jgi:hypothetical protein